MRLPYRLDLVPILEKRAATFRSFTRLGDRKIEMVHHSIYGWVWSPHDLEEFARVIDHLAWSSAGAWRGHADIEWKLDSAAARRLLRAGAGELTEKRMAAYEADLLARTRMLALDLHGSRPLSDLELLARLQHHGAATRLLDFSRSVYVALWFSMRERPDDYGLLIGLDVRDAWRLTDPFALGWPIARVMRKTGDRIGIWHPSALSPRIPAQSGLFLWSRAVTRPWGSVGPARLAVDPADAGFICIAVSPALKDSLELQAASMFGFSAETLFPDFDGFATAHGANEPTDF